MSRERANVDHALEFVGYRFGPWRVLQADTTPTPPGKPGRKRTRLLCRCSCGREEWLTGRQVQRRGATTNRCRHTMTGAITRALRGRSPTLRELSHRRPWTAENLRLAHERAKLRKRRP